MSDRAKAFLVNVAKHAVNAGLLSLAPVYHDPSKYNLHNVSGIKGVSEIVLAAILVKEGMVYVPKILSWSASTNDGGTK